MGISSQAVSVKGVLFRNHKGSLEVLLLRNDRSEWELPGGRIDGAESPGECLSREFLEETALVVEVGPLVHRGVLIVEPPHVPAMTSISISAYGCRMKEPAGSETSIVLSTEHLDARWMPVSSVATRSDLPEIYKVAIRNWYRISDRQP
ncbi:MAG TPA: NUDIX hydrolase [Terracidiphilus sp.]